MPIIAIITWSGGATDAMLELRLGACRGGTARATAGSAAARALGSSMNVLRYRLTLRDLSEMFLHPQSRVQYEAAREWGRRRLTSSANLDETCIKARGRCVPTVALISVPTPTSGWGSHCLSAPSCQCPVQPRGRDTYGQLTIVINSAYSTSYAGVPGATKLRTGRSPPWLRPVGPNEAPSPAASARAPPPLPLEAAGTRRRQVAATRDR